AVCAPRVGPPRKGGAGLELDLADPRQRERLPDALRGGLPECGFVNLAEAQAVVRLLESLVADARLRGAAQASPNCPALGVLALYPAQAELIRRLVQQSPLLAAAGPDVKVNVPAAFREGECWVALLSLTRSHTHRAVSFGEGPQTLAVALSRARSRL